MEPLLPPAPGRGRKRAWPLREIVDAIFYVLRGGIAWRLLPDCFPPWGTVYRWFVRLRDGGVLWVARESGAARGRKPVRTSCRPPWPARWAVVGTR